MSSTYGENLKLTVFGQSHGPAIGMTLDAIPAGLPVDEQMLAAFMARRAPGSNAYSTSRKEADQVQFLSGIVDGYTCGAPIAAIIENQNTRSSDYENIKDRPRPGHADFTAQVKYGGFQDVAGGNGHPDPGPFIFCWNCDGRIHRYDQRAAYCITGGFSCNQ